MGLQIPSHILGKDFCGESFYRTSLLRYEFHLTITWRITDVHEIVGVGREAPWTFLAI